MADYDDCDWVWSCFEVNIKVVWLFSSWISIHLHWRTMKRSTAEHLQIKKPYLSMNGSGISKITLPLSKRWGSQKEENLSFLSVILLLACFSVLPVKVATINLSKFQVALWIARWTTQTCIQFIIREFIIRVMLHVRSYRVEQNTNDVVKKATKN